VPLPRDAPAAEAALLANPRIRDVLGEPLLGAFLAVRHADAAWARERSADDIVTGHLWRY
jgi:glutamine synthetase